MCAYKIVMKHSQNSLQALQENGRGKKRKKSSHCINWFATAINFESPHIAQNFLSDVSDAMCTKHVKNSVS